VTDGRQWEKAESALGHVQQAASEMIAAAHDALDLLDGVVSTADLGEVVNTFNHLGRALRNRGRPTASSGRGPAPTSAREPPARPPSAVQRISVR
jgi:hypothetical protein